MRSIRHASRIFAIAQTFALIGSAAIADTVTIPKDTDVPLVFDQSLSSKTAKEGDKVAMHVSQNVVVGGKTVIAEGTKVTGIISKVDKRGRFGVNAKIRLALNPIRATGGHMIALEPKSKGKFTGSRTDQAAYASGGGALLLGPIGLVGGYFVTGKSVNVKPGDHLTSAVVEDTVVSVR